MLLKQSSRLAVQRFCQPAESPDTRISSASLQVAYVATFHTHRQRKFFLRKAAHLAEAANIFSKQANHVHVRTWQQA